MATISELARHSGLPAETVLRVVLRQGASADAQRRVAAAVAALGPPDYPRPNGEVQVLPAEDEQPAAVPAARHGDDPLLEYTAQLHAVLAQLVERSKAERGERVEDLELMSELLIEGWRGVDRRLGRLEKALARIEAALTNGGGPAHGRQASFRRLEEWMQPRHEPNGT